MNVLIVGCGSVGSQLARELDKKGHDVSVIDINQEKLDALPSDFGGFTTTGVPIDREVLKRAGIETCDALCAVTDNDNINIMTSELAREMYNVPRVFARVTDIGKSELFERLGIRTICPTRLTVNAVSAALEESGHVTAEISFENHTVTIYELEVPEELIDQTPGDIVYERGEILFGIIKRSTGLILYSGQNITFEKGDKLIFAKKI